MEKILFGLIFYLFINFFFTAIPQVAAGEAGSFGSRGLGAPELDGKYYSIFSKGKFIFKMSKYHAPS